MDEEMKSPEPKLIEKNPYFSENIKTPAWDRFKNALIKVYNLDKDKENG